jgi:PIN domain nuclease of toxin-antitoxin system
MKIYVVDTHALAWFFAQDSRLSSTIDNVLTQAENGETQILIPTLVLAELTLIAQKQRVPISMTTILGEIQQTSGFIIVDFDFAVFQRFIELPPEWDLHDRIIAATAKQYNVTLITRDQALQDSAAIETLW